MAVQGRWIENDVLNITGWGNVFLRRLCSLFQRQQFCDGTLIFDDGSSLKVHKLIMMMYSEYFQKEELWVNGEFKIPRLPSSVVKPIIRFMYTGYLKLKPESHRKNLIQVAKCLRVTILWNVFREYALDVKAMPGAPADDSGSTSSSAASSTSTTPNCSSVEAVPIESDTPSSGVGEGGQGVESAASSSQAGSELPLVEESTIKEKEGVASTSLAVDELIQTDELKNGSSTSVEPVETQTVSKRSIQDPASETAKKIGKRRRMNENNSAVSSEMIHRLVVSKMGARNPSFVKLLSMKSLLPELNRLSTAPGNGGASSSGATETPPVSPPAEKSQSSRQNQSKSVNKIVSELVKRNLALIKELRILRKMYKVIEKNLGESLVTRGRTIELLQSDAEIVLETTGNTEHGTKGPWLCNECSITIKFEIFYLYRRHMHFIHNKTLDLSICPHCGYKLNEIDESSITKYGNINFPRCEKCTYVPLSDCLIIKHSMNAQKSIKNYLKQTDPQHIVHEIIRASRARNSGRTTAANQSNGRFTPPLLRRRREPEAENSVEQ